MEFIIGIWKVGLLSFCWMQNISTIAKHLEKFISCYFLFDSKVVTLLVDSSKATARLSDFSNPVVRNIQSFDVC